MADGSAAQRRPDIRDGLGLFGDTPMRGVQSAVLFAGGGGACIGIKDAVGLSPFLAVNHSPAAIEMHAANHPDTIHLCESIRDVKPREACRGRRVDVLWASPDCTHFSVARGGAPKSKEIRGLAWMVCRWAAEVRPPIIFLENVWEFTSWGPISARRRKRNGKHSGGQPIKARAGETFRLFVGHLRALGYVVEWRKLRACDYGTPTTRERLYLIARNDGAPIVWPEPTHGPRRAQPWHTAAECIDFSIPMLSIFATPAEAKAWAKANGRKGVPRRPLADATLRRIAEGVKRYVLESPTPYIVTTGHQSRDGGKVRRAGEPLSTVVTKAEHLLVVPSLIATRNGEREGQAPRTHDIGLPYPTVTAQGSQGAVVAAFLAQHNGGANGHQAIGQDLRAPLSTIAGNINKAAVAVHLMTNTSGNPPSPADAPLKTITSAGNQALVAALIVAYYGSETGQHQRVDEPLHTIVSKARFGLVTVTIDGTEYVVIDIAMRMLTPRELATANGFPADYILTGTDAEQVERIGNAVCRQVASALVGENLPVPDDTAMAAK